MSERYYVNVSSLAELSPGDYVVHPVIGGFKVARNWQPSYDREVKARALRSAAERIDLSMAYEHDDAEYRNAESAAEAWLRLEADRIESQEAPVSALTEKVAREHASQGLVEPGVLRCICGRRSTASPQAEGRDLGYVHLQHVAEVTEAATRAAVAADIRAEQNEGDYGTKLAHEVFDIAARITEGGERE